MLLCCYIRQRAFHDTQLLRSPCEVYASHSPTVFIPLPAGTSCVAFTNHNLVVRPEDIRQTLTLYLWDYLTNM